MQIYLPPNLDQSEIEFIEEFIDLVENGDEVVIDDDIDFEDEETIAVFTAVLSLVDEEMKDYYAEEDYRNMFVNILKVLMSVTRRLDDEDVYMINGAYLSGDGLFIAHINPAYTISIEEDKALDVYERHEFV